MNNNMTATPEQKKELIVQALGIAGFTEKENYQGMYTLEHGMKTIVVNLNESPIKSYFNVDKKKVTDDDEHNTLAKVDKMITEAEDSRTPTKTEPDIIVNTDAKEGTPEQPSDAQTEAEPASQEPVERAVQPPADHTGTASPPSPPSPPSTQHKSPQKTVELTIDIVKKYINEKVTDQEAYKFIQLCNAKNLNPFLGQVYLIKREFTGTAQMVVGKDGFMERAERDSQYAGFEAGIIVKNNDKSIKDLPGAFHSESEILVGGWAKVYRKDREHPIEARVLLKEYDTGKASWNRMKATMIRKVAVVQGHREAFPSELSGMYEQSEVDVEVE